MTEDKASLARRLTAQNKLVEAAQAWKDFRSAGNFDPQCCSEEISVLRRIRHYDEAQDVLAQAKAVLGESLVLTREEARLAEVHRRWEEANKLWCSLHQSLPDDMESALGRFSALVRLGRADNADRILESAIALPGRSHANLKTALLLSLALSRCSLTMRIANDILAVAPNDGDAFWAMGSTYTSSGELDAAEAVLVRGLDLADHPLIPVVAAEVATLRQDWTTASYRWATLLERQSHRAWRRLRFVARSGPAAPWIELANAQFKSGDADAAYLTIDRALALLANDLSLLRCRARLATQAKNRALAGSAWNEAIIASGNDAPIIEEAFAAAWMLDADTNVARPREEAGTTSSATGFLTIAESIKAHNDAVKNLAPAAFHRESSDQSVEIVHNAYVMPGGPCLNASKRGSYQATGGVFASSGRLVPQCIQTGFAINHQPNPLFGPTAGFSALPGKWLYGAGQLYNHIGHFLMDCIGRLWAADLTREPFDGVLYLSKIRAEVEDNRMQFAKAGRYVGFARSDNHPFIHPIIEVFSGIKTFKAISMPTIVEELWVPQQLLGLSDEMLHGSAGFRAFVRGKVDQIVVNHPAAKKIFVSRAKFSSGRGALLGENILERILAREGYDIFYPERVSFAEQLARYRDASHIIVSGGSAAHIIALAMRNTQRVAVVGRLPAQSGFFVKQLRSFGALEAVGIDRLDGHFSSYDRAGELIKEPQTRRPHSLDVRAVLVDLVAHGFIDRFDEGALQASLAREDRTEFIAKLSENAADRTWQFVPYPGHGA